jgi:2-dehydropantoate 2-reductase
MTTAGNGPVAADGRVCVAGAGAIGSLLAAHLGRVVPVDALVRRPEHAAALRSRGLTVSGRRSFTATVGAATVVDELPGDTSLVIIATKATEVDGVASALVERFGDRPVVTIQNGMGADELVARHWRGPHVSGLTFLSGHRRDDGHVVFELDAPTWLGPYRHDPPSQTAADALARLLGDAGLQAVAVDDIRPERWAKLIFNAAVSTVSAITGLPHNDCFAREDRPGDLGHLVHALIDEGRSVARAHGIHLREDPWQMNLIGSATAHPASMLLDVLAGRPTETDFIAGAVVRAADEVGLEVPLHRTVHALLRARQSAAAPLAAAGDLR